MRCPYCERHIDQGYVNENADKPEKSWLRVGDVIEGFCGGHFGRDSYGPRTITEVSLNTGLEARDHTLGIELEGTLVDSRFYEGDDFDEHIMCIVRCADSITRDGRDIRRDIADEMKFTLPEDERMDDEATAVKAPKPITTVPPRVGPGAPIEAVLIHTRGILTPEGVWIQGTFAKRPDTPTTKKKKEEQAALGYEVLVDCSAVDSRSVAWSLEGAMLRACGGPGYDAACAFLCQELGVERTEHWSDVEGRTQEEVLATLDGIIAKLIGKVPA